MGRKSFSLTNHDRRTNNLKKEMMQMKQVVQMPTINLNKKSDVAQNFDLQERIRVRAYELYEQRGRENGRELDDWLQAEAEATTEIAA